jgi:hypothetical protein
VKTAITPWFYPDGYDYVSKNQRYLLCGDTLRHWLQAAEYYGPIKRIRFHLKEVPVGTTHSLAWDDAGMEYVAPSGNSVMFTWQCDEWLEKNMGEHASFTVRPEIE